VEIFHLSPWRSWCVLSFRHPLFSDNNNDLSLKELDIIVNAASLEALKTEITKELTEYAQEYMDEFDKYYGAPNRKPHFPYVMRVLIQKDEYAVNGLLDA